ncbi:MAG: hypothetical protein Q9162_004746 [Coniocarpon cinnabarinum]
MSDPNGIYTGALLTCPGSMTIYDSRSGKVLADRTPYTACTPNALNTVEFDGGAITTDEISIVFTAKLALTLAISEAQIWVPAETGPRYEAEDSLMGAFIGGFEGRYAGGNSSLIRPSYNTTLSNDTGALTDGGVLLGDDAWIEWAGVVAPENASGDIVIEGSGNGSMIVQVNFLRNTTVTFSQNAAVPNATNLEVATLNRTILSGNGGQRENATASGFDFLYGGNVVTIWQGDGMPFVDAIYIM